LVEQGNPNRLLEDNKQGIFYDMATQSKIIWFNDWFKILVVC
jgi:hypothetical protein